MESTRTLITNEHQAWNILAAAGWSIHRRTGGISDAFVIYTEGCPSDSAVSCAVADRTAYITPDDFDFKYPTAHMLGHLIAGIANGSDFHNDDDTPSGGTCTEGDGKFAAKYFSSHAAVEGIAWYYAAAAFNNTSESDCEVYFPGDYDQDTTLGEDDANELTPSCEGDPENEFESWPNLDYIADVCGGTLEDRGVALDWTRAFWDLDTDQDVPTTDIFNIWDLADPDDWDVNGGSTTGDDPDDRMQEAADTLSYGEEWEFTVPNGIR